jgi:hypothetical protein
MARKYSLEDHPDFHDIDPQLWKEAQKRESEKDGLLLDGWTREEWLSYVYYLVLQQIATKGLDVSLMDSDELQLIITEFKTATKHVMTPPYQRHYFNKNVSA